MPVPTLPRREIAFSVCAANPPPRFPPPSFGPTKGRLMARLFLLIAALLVIFVLRFFLRRFFAQVGPKAVATQPDAIHLQRSANPAWRNPAAVEEIARTLVACSFTDLGAFTAPEMPPLIIRLFAQ